MNDYEKEVNDAADAMLKDMKENIKTHPELKKTLKNMMDDGLEEDEALGIMILAWLEHTKRRGLQMNELFLGIYCAMVGLALLYCLALIMGITHNKGDKND